MKVLELLGIHEKCQEMSVCVRAAVLYISLSCLDHVQHTGCVPYKLGVQLGGKYRQVPPNIEMVYGFWSPACLDFQNCCSILNFITLSSNVSRMVH